MAYDYNVNLIFIPSYEARILHPEQASMLFQENLRCMIKFFNTDILFLPSSGVSVLRPESFKK